MKDYKEYYTTLSKGEGNSTREPSVYEYLFIKVIDNGLVLVLMVLLLSFLVVALISENDRVSMFSMDAVKLCLGVFLGLFAGKKRT